MNIVQGNAKKKKKKNAPVSVIPVINAIKRTLKKKSIIL